eukprot:1576288-Lingulodinium_polyedra.AAC.1
MVTASTRLMRMRISCRRASAKQCNIPEICNAIQNQSRHQYRFIFLYKFVETAVQSTMLGASNGALPPGSNNATF